MAKARVAVIGGSGLYQMEGLASVQEVRPSTPFGTPSDVITVGELHGISVAFLPRHGRGHRIGPTELPARANIYALKLLGVERIISVSAVGSLNEQVHPLDMVVPDQLIDRTGRRQSTFFGDGVVAHVGFANPFCPDLSAALVQAARAAGAKVRQGGVCVVIEGPAFSTRAESVLYQSWGASIIGMTALPEAKLAREAEICYATLACVTDYDCWRETEEEVSVTMVVDNLNRNAATAKEVLGRVIPRLTGARTCKCASALRDAVITSHESIPAATRERLAPILGKYLA